MLLLLAVLLTACHSGDKEEINSSDEDCFLDIYVYAPERPIVTRADVGDIKSTDAESKVNTLQIWVFKSSNGDRVGYLNADPHFLNETGQQKYRMKISNDFAKAPEKVDVYVVANAASCELTLDDETSRDDLAEAKIQGEHFGTGTISGDITTGLQSTVPDTGLPMSAVAKNQPIDGSFPTLRIGTSEKMTVMQLTRAVSKLRFVLCRITEKETSTKKLVGINSISLAEKQIPTQSCLFPRESYSYTYITDPIKYGPVAKGAIHEVANPLVYVYETQNAQDYEDLINAASDETEDADEKAANLHRLEELGITGLTVADLPQLKEFGLTYLRESDLRLTGTINYTYNENNVEKTDDVSFTMANPGDFLRNHSWIIYIYYMDSKIYVFTVTHIGMKNWTDDGVPENTTFYNW